MKRVSTGAVRKARRRRAKGTKRQRMTAYEKARNADLNAMAMEEGKDKRPQPKMPL